MDSLPQEFGAKGSFIQYGGVADHALVVRGITTVFNTDYITDVIFHLNGAIKVGAPLLQLPDGKISIEGLSSVACPEMRSRGTAPPARPTPLRDVLGVTGACELLSLQCKRC